MGQVVNNNFLGNNKIVAMLPASAGDSSDWTPTGSANHYATVNENPPDDDTTYVQDSTNWPQGFVGLFHAHWAGGDCRHSSQHGGQIVGCGELRL